MKTKELCMLLAGLFMVGCSADEEIANISTSESNAISFNVVSNNPQTKADLITNAGDLQSYPFDVFAFKSDGSLFMGTTSEEYTHDGVEISWQSGAWTYTNSDEKKYWPHEALHFYAVYPVLSMDTDYDRWVFMSWLMNWDNHKIWYSTFDEFGGSTSSKNVDVMYAVSPYQNKNTHGGVVSLQFQHALSQVLFKAKTEDPNIEVEIKEMSIHNFAYTGTFTFPSFDDNGHVDEVDNSLWASSSSPYCFAIGMNDSPIQVSHSGVDISSGDKAMLFIPQTLSPWVPSSGGVNVADSNKLSYLQINCRIWNGSHYFVGGESSYENIYVPFSANWQPGKRYIYTLVFGGGYTESGGEIDLRPITFDAVVTDWVDEGSDITDF